jgi:phage baseplate assembly protein W
MRRDIDVTRSHEGLSQALVNRLKTRRGELASLGHPEYGSRHHELIGEPNVERVRALIKLYILQALRHEPRIEKVLDVTVRAESQPPRDRVRIEIRAAVVGESTPLNLVVPFALEGGS